MLWPIKPGINSRMYLGTSIKKREHFVCLFKRNFLMEYQQYSICNISRCRPSMNFVAKFTTRSIPSEHRAYTPRRRRFARRLIFFSDKKHPLKGLLSQKTPFLKYLDNKIQSLVNEHFKWLILCFQQCLCGLQCLGPGFF